MKARFPLHLPEKIALHHSAGARRTSFAAIRRLHMVDNGWAEIGYHYVILESGSVRVGRIVPERGCAVKRRNTGVISILVMGDNTRMAHRWTQQQATHTAQLCEDLISAWPHLAGEIYGHRDVAADRYPTLCPGLDVPKLINKHDWDIQSYWEGEKNV